jgi:phosphatidylinositol alpha-1,6-mannosyltransferase
MAFGARVAALQAAGMCDWMFFTHLAVAKTQLFVPSALRRRYAVFVHGIEAWRPLGLAEQQALSGASLRIANSEFTARRVRAMHPAIGDIASCPLSLMPSRGGSACADHPMSFDPGPQAVLLVARMSSSERYKGHDQLLEAWPATLARLPDARLIFVGDGDDAARLKAKASALGIAGSTIFTGFLNDGELQAFYRRSAVFAMPSRGEGFGLVYLEAMAHRLPCIGSVEDAAGEIIDDGATGFLIEQSDRAALVDRLVRLLGDDALRRQMGEAGFRRSQDRFGYDQFSQRVVSLVEAHLTPATAAWRERAAL